MMEEKSLELKNYRKCGNPDCKHNQPLSLTSFYRYPDKSIYNICRDCHKAKVKNNIERKAEEAGCRAYEEGLISKDEIDDAISLFKSCRSRIQSCKYNMGIYKDVECDWDDPYQFMKDILTLRDTGISFWDSLWDDWKKQREIYLNSKDEEEKPELDRVHARRGIGYKIGTVRCLSDRLNRELANLSFIPIRIKLFKDGQLIQERHFAGIRKSIKWIRTELNIKCSQKRIQSNIDKEPLILKEGYKIEINSLEYIIEELEIEKENN